MAAERSAHALIAALEPEAIVDRATERAPVAIPTQLVTLATSIGQAWAATYIHTLQIQDRDIVGAWPGTLREARRQVLVRLPKLDPEALEQLARMTNLAARRSWESVSEPDLES